MRTTFPRENEESGASDTVLTQETPESRAEPEKDVKFPKRIKFRGRPLATIYRPSKHYPNYRVAWTAGGRRMMKGFHRYGDAKSHADTLVKDLAKGSQVTALTPGQATDALAALERLQRFYVDTGRRVSLLAGISEYCEATGKLAGRPLGEAVDGYLNSVAAVKRMDLAEAVEQFIATEEPRTQAKDGKRADLCPKYAYNRAIRLRRFAATFANTAVCDLAKEHLDAFMAAEPVAEFSHKTRNHHRAVIRQFLQWAVRKDYLAANHRLFEADGMRAENGNTAEIQFYTLAEFKALLDASEGPMRAMIAIGGLAGLRTAELLRLTWEDTRRVENHIEVTAAKAKTRQRRLVEIVPALTEWLAPFHGLTGKICTLHEITWQQHFCKVCEKAQVAVKGKMLPVERKPNGLRHAFCTYHFALHGNENLTAQQAGNSPAMLHGNYKGLATKTEAEKWFAVAPERPANIVPLAAAPAAQESPR
jgi:integrase